MPPVPGIVLGGAAVPTDSADTYPVTDPQWGKGGLRRVLTTTARNAIPIPRLERGMEVFVAADTTTYRLKETWSGGVPVDADWEVAIGPTGGISGAGSTNSVAYWGSPTTLAANIFFIRNPQTSVVYNNFGFTADQGVTIERYVDPAGNDASDGLTPGTAWQTIGYALSQMPLAGTGTYRIYIGAGTYSLLAFSIPSAITAFGSPLYGNTLIEFIGDETTPSNVVFSNNGPIIYHSSPNVVARFAGIRFVGATTNDCYEHRGTGAIFFKDCEFHDFNRIGQSMFGGVVYLELSIAPALLTSVAGGFSASVGATIVINSEVDMTYRTLLSEGEGMFNVDFGGTVANLASGATFNLTGDILGSFFSGEGGRIYAGDNCTFTGTGITGPFILDNGTFVQMGESNTVDINGAAVLLDVRGNSYFKDSDTNWIAASVPGGVIIEGGSRIESSALVNSTIPLLDLVSWFPDASSLYGQDNRYLNTAIVRTMGNLPQGFTTNYLTELGSTADEYPIYIAKGPATIVGIRVSTRIGNGSGHTDTYQVYVNGSAPSTPFGVTITNDTSASDFFGDVALVAGDRVSVVFTSDAATTAEDVTVEVYIRVEG